MLDLPDIRQRDAYSCGPAAVRCALAALGRRVPDLLTRLCTTDLDGTDPRSIEGFLRQAGFAVQSGEMTLADLRHHTTAGRPVLALVSLWGGHYVTVGGISRSRVHFQDPSDGPQVLRADAWEGIWSSVDRFGACYRRFGLAVFNG